MRPSHLTVVTLLGVGALSAGACSKKSSGDAPTPQQEHTFTLSAEAVKNAQLGYATAGPRKITERFTVSGDLKRDRKRITLVVPKVGGVVKSVAVRQGAAVPKGATLAVLESRELADLKLAYLKTAQGGYLARKAFKREERLYKRQVATRDAYLKKKGALSQAMLAHQVAERKLRILGLGPKELQGLSRQKPKVLPRYALRAPAAGTVLKVGATVGAALKADQTAFELADLSAVWGEVRVPGHQLQGVATGQSVKISNRRLGIRAQARVIYVAPEADPNTRTVLVRLEVPNPKGAWRPGCVLSAHFELPGAKAAVVVPRAALHSVGDKSTVFVSHGKHRFEARPVVLASKGAAWVSVARGLKPGERVVTTNSLTLKAEYQNRSQR